MSKFIRSAGLARAGCLAMLVGFLAGCSGGSSNALDADNNEPVNDPPAQILGVTTPGSVAVVTATNTD